MRASVAGTVTPIRTATNTALKAIRPGTATTIGITPNGKTAYVAVQGNGTLVPIRTASTKGRRAFAGSAPLPVTYSPILISITPDQPE